MSFVRSSVRHGFSVASPCRCYNRAGNAVLDTTFLHVVICFFLIIVVLLQSGKAADLAGAFGGMGSQTVFGPRGTATVLSKATTIAASSVYGDVACAGDHGQQPSAKHWQRP